MNSNPDPPRWGWKGLRHRYRPNHRISRGMVTAAPWADIVLLIVLFLLCCMPFVSQPGITIELPATHIGAGHPFGHKLVVLLQSGHARDTDDEIVFFDDRRFQFDAQRDDLLEALRRAVASRPDAPLIIEADQRVRHGLLVELYTLAADAGVREINVATRPF